MKTQLEQVRAAIKEAGGICTGRGAAVLMTGNAEMERYEVRGVDVLLECEPVGQLGRPNVFVPVERRAVLGDLLAAIARIGVVWEASAEEVRCRVDFWPVAHMHIPMEHDYKMMCIWLLNLGDRCSFVERFREFTMSVKSVEERVDARVRNRPTKETELVRLVLQRARAGGAEWVRFYTAKAEAA